MSESVREQAERVAELSGVCAKHYPKCCSYHEGWDDAFHVADEAGLLAKDEHPTERAGRFYLQTTDGENLYEARLVERRHVQGEESMTVVPTHDSCPECESLFTLRYIPTTEATG